MRVPFAAILILGLAFGLRAARLDYQSLWYDEGSSIYLSRQSLGAITRGTAADIHPPLYYYFLHFWMRAGGSSEYAVRSMSVAAGMLTVVLLFVLGRRLFGSRAGLLASFAGAISPLLIYFSQETRMYAQVTLFALLSTYLLVLALSPCEKARVRAPLLWTSYAAAMILCLYSQYIGALALAFHGLYIVLARRRALLPFLAGGGAAVLVFAPWLALAKNSLLGWPSTDAFHAGPQLFADAAFRYVEGLSASAGPLTIALTLAVCALASLSLWHFARVRAPFSDGLLLPILYLAVPLVAMFLLGYRKPIYNPKFALLALPGFSLLLGAGLDALGKLKAGGLVLLMISAGYALNNYYTDPAFQRDNYRGLAQFITTSARPGDAIILNAPGQEQVFPYYYHGNLPLIGLPGDRPLNQAKTSQELTRLSQQYRRLWLVLYGTNGSDPSGYVEHWLASKDFEVQNQWFGNVRLAAFAAPSSRPAANHPADATIGAFAHLAGYSLTPPRVPSGDVLQLGMKWQAQATPKTNAKVFTHIIDGEGNIWAQRDSDPQGGARPTSTWKPGDTIADNYGLLVLPGTPPGQYQAEIGMYNPSDGKRLPVTSGGQGDRLLLSGVQVISPPQPPSIDELHIPHALDRQFGSIGLLGYGLTLTGQDAERDTFAAGDQAHLSLFWQAGASSGADANYRIELQQAGSQLPGGPLAQGTLLPQHPTATWRAGDRYRDQHRLQLPRDAHGDFNLILRVDGRDATTLLRMHVR